MRYETYRDLPAGSMWYVNSMTYVYERGKKTVGPFKYPVGSARISLDIHFIPTELML